MIEQPRVERMLAHLLAFSGTRPEEVYAAVSSALDMGPGERVSLDMGEYAEYRRTFIQEQGRRLMS